MVALDLAKSSGYDKITQCFSAASSLSIYATLRFALARSAAFCTKESYASAKIAESFTTDYARVGAGRRQLATKHICSPRRSTTTVVCA